MKPITPINGLVIRHDIKLEPGTWLLPDGLNVAADNVTIDGNGAVLVGLDRGGQGISVFGNHGVTIKNLRLQEYQHGIFAHQCQQLTITNCQITATAELLPNTDFLDIWLPAERAYGGGILLQQVTDSQIIANDLQHQMNGLLAYNCQRLTVSHNLANYCSGFGFHLYNTSDSLYEHNYADYCCRYQPRGLRQGHLGADSAGFLITHRSSRNIFRSNMARLSGDGFFLAGLTPQGEPVSCDDNLFEYNDGSYSPNIAFEATFSSGNIYRHNRADHCNYGFWLGFSRGGVLTANQINGNHQAGIAVENGFDFTVSRNTFTANGHGILLWSKYVPQFAQAVPENDTSRHWLIEHNTFSANRKAIRVAANQDHGIRPMPPTPKLPRPHSHVIQHNQINDSHTAIELTGIDNTVIDNNQMTGNVNDEIVTG